MLGSRVRAADPSFTDSVLQIVSIANPRTPRLRGTLVLQAYAGGGQVVVAGTRV
jgi:hypothetical protein